MRRALALALLLAGPGAQAEALFFDDFLQPDTTALRQDGWVLREGQGHPGVPGARWQADAIRLQGGELRLQAHSDGRPEGTVQAQLCHQRKLLEGTWSARVRWSDTPLQGPAGDPVIQTFYAVAPLRHDFDPDFSELDWEYLAHGGWGSPQPRLYAINWQTVRLSPWQAHNQALQRPGSHAGWQQLSMQVGGGHTRWFLNDEEIAVHGGRAQPVQPMALAFSVWFSPDGLLPPSAGLRRHEQAVDWVMQLPGQRLSPAAVRERVAALRRAGIARVDTVPPADPPLDSPCDF